MSTNKYICHQCKIEFTPKDKRHSKFCTQTCSQKYSRAKVKNVYEENPKLCSICKSIISYEKHQNGNIFCSSKCGGIHSNNIRTTESRQRQRASLIKSNGLPTTHGVQYKRYKQLCSFRFIEKYYDTFLGYDLYVKHGFYNPLTKKDGVCHDHMFSVKSGFDLKMHPDIISHPANCQFLMNSVNSLKGSDNAISKEILFDNILKWATKHNEPFDNYLFEQKIDTANIKHINRRSAIKHPYTPIKYSSITGRVYNNKLKPALGWNNPNKISAKVLSKMFNFVLGDPYNTERNILNSINILCHMYHIDKKTPNEIQQYFNIEYSSFHMFLKNINIF